MAHQGHTQTHQSQHTDILESLGSLNDAIMLPCMLLGREWEMTHSGMMMGWSPHRLSGFIVMRSSLTFAPWLQLMTLTSHRLKERERIKAIVTKFVHFLKIIWLVWVSWWFKTCSHSAKMVWVVSRALLVERNCSLLFFMTNNYTKLLC